MKKRNISQSVSKTPSLVYEVNPLERQWIDLKEYPEGTKEVKINLSNQETRQERSETILRS